MKDIRIHGSRGKPRILKSVVKSPDKTFRSVKSSVKNIAARIPNEDKSKRRSESSPQDYANSKVDESFQRTRQTAQDGANKGFRKGVDTIKKKIVSDAKSRNLKQKERTVKQKPEATVKDLRTSENPIHNNVNLQKSEISKARTENIKVKGDTLKTHKPDGLSGTNSADCKVKLQADKSIKAPNKGFRNSVNIGKNESNRIRRVTKKTIKTSKKAAKKTAKTAAKISLKSSKVAVKTANRSVKTAAKAAKASAKAAKVAAKAAAKAAKAAMRAVKTAAKAIQAIIKATVAAIKALISAIAAGSWVAILIILIIVVVVILVCTIFGIFYAEDENRLTIKHTVEETNAAFETAMQNQIENLKRGGTYDKINVIYDGNMDGDGDVVNNWRDVLIVFAAKTLQNGQTPMELTDQSKAELNHLFYTMNEVSYRAEVITETVGESEGDEEDGEDSEEEPQTVTTLNIFVTVTSKTWEEMATLLSFNESQMQIAEELTKPEYYSLFADLIGVGLVECGTPSDLTEIISGLPPGAQNNVAVEAALTRIGDPYSQPLRGQGRYVDCSYFVWWAYNKVGKSMPTTSVEQAKYYVDAGLTVGRAELQPGDLVFWSKTTCSCGRWNEIHHVGMYIGDDKVIEASSSKGQVVVSKMWGLNGGKWQVFAFARP